MPRTFYEVLEVPADASQAAIRDAYREKVKEYHPDVCDRTDAEEQFKRVKRAEDVLGDPEERAIYDELGHETYVDDLAPGSAGDDREPDDADDVRAAAASAAAGDHDGGGRSAGWRQREREARRRGGHDWVDDLDGFHVGFDRDDPGRHWTYSPPDDEAADGADERSRRDPWSHGSSPAGSSRSGGSTARSGSARSSSARSKKTRGAARGDGGREAAAASAADASPHAATQAWGNRERRTHTHAVHEWPGDDAGWSAPRPDLTQDELVFLGSSLFLYPILLFSIVFPAFTTPVNVAMGVLAFAYVAFLLPRPALGLPVFGAWSVGIPALLTGFGVPMVSFVGIVSLVGVWVPFLFSAAVALVLVR